MALYSLLSIYVFSAVTNLVKLLESLKAVSYAEIS
jgi:hypothetical protein